MFSLVTLQLLSHYQVGTVFKKGPATVFERLSESLKIKYTPRDFKAWNGSIDEPEQMQVNKNSKDRHSKENGFIL